MRQSRAVPETILQDDSPKLRLGGFTENDGELGFAGFGWIVEG
jgi:hypothetical protein